MRAEVFPDTAYAIALAAPSDVFYGGGPLDRGCAALAGLAPIAVTLDEARLREAL